MKKLTMVFVLAAVIVSIAFTGAFAGPPDDAEKRNPKREETGSPKQRPGNPQDAARNENRLVRDKTIRDFQKALRDAERKFKEDEKAASKLQGDERKAAMKKAADEMKASIKKAEKDKDAVLGERGPGRHQPGGRMDHPLQDTGESPVSVDQEIAGQAGGQLKGDTRSLPDQQKK